MKNKLLSNCCNEPIFVETEDEGTNYWRCSKCDQPCDPAATESKKQEWEGLTNTLKVADKIMDILKEHGISPRAVVNLIKMINELLIEEKSHQRKEVIEEVKNKIKSMNNPYPESVFTPTGESDDARFGTFGRLVFKNTIEDILSLLDNLEKEEK